MIRRMLPALAVLALTPAVVHAQDLAITVSAPSAEVHKGPSTVTPVVGHVPRGAVLPIARNLGSWVRVPWPDAPDGVGYLHVTMGRIAPAVAAGPATDVSRPPTAAATAASSAPVASQARAPIDPRLASRRPIASTPASHIVGIGGLFGSPQDIGATARAWSGRRVGVQFAFVRASATNGTTADRLTALQFEPGVMYGLFDRVSDYVWIRPYVGSTMTISRETLNGATGSAPAADTSVGLRIFGGSEFMFASLPRFGLSADAGYRRFQSPFAGFDTDRLSIAVAGHWYVK